MRPLYRCLSLFQCGALKPQPGMRLSVQGGKLREPTIRGRTMGACQLHIKNNDFHLFKLKIYLNIQSMVIRRMAHSHFSHGQKQKDTLSFSTPHAFLMRSYLVLDVYAVCETRFSTPYDCPVRFGQPLRKRVDRKQYCCHLNFHSNLQTRRHIYLRYL